jgi:hypothetical protein
MVKAAFTLRQNDRGGGMQMIGIHTARVPSRQ